MQNIKDFDFQIKKNQEDIGVIGEKIDNLSKDLDDLVSLYEIVSEQMNPFVGLSKVTKKRIDALESFTREMEELKERTAELESFAERSGAQIKNLGEIKKDVKTINTETILGDSDKEGKKIDETKDDIEAPKGEVEHPPEKDESQQPQPENKSEQPVSETKTTADTETTEVKTSEEVELPKTAVPPAPPTEQPIEELSHQTIGPTNPEPVESNVAMENLFTGEQQPLPYPETNTQQEFSDSELDRILERALSSLSVEGTLDKLIEDFIENLKR